MDDRFVPLVALDQEIRKPIMRTGKIGSDFERPSIRPNRLIQPSCSRKRDGHVHVDLRLVGTIAQRESIRGKRRVIVPLALERERLAQVIETLRLEIAVGLVAEQTTP